MLRFSLFAGAARTLIPALPVVVLALVCLGACSPRYNWRVVEASDGFTATFPARVQKQSRDVEIGAIAASMTMTGAEVEHVSFVIGVASLKDDAGAAQAPAALAAAMAKNLSVAEPALSRQTMALVGSQVRVDGIGFDLAGGDTEVFGRIALRSGHVVEVLVAGPASAFKDNDTVQARDTFFDSVALY